MNKVPILKIDFFQYSLNFIEGKYVYSLKSTVHEKKSFFKTLCVYARENMCEEVVMKHKAHKCRFAVVSVINVLGRIGCN